MSAIDAMTMTPVEMLTDRRLTPMELEQLSAQARSKRTRVVITGMGAITPLGLTPDEFWQNLLAGKSGIAPVTLFDPTPYKTRIAAQVQDFDPRRYLDSKDARRLGRATAFAVAAARGAIADAGFKDRFEVLSSAMRSADSSKGFANMTSFWKKVPTALVRSPRR